MVLKKFWVKSGRRYIRIYVRLLVYSRYHSDPEHKGDFDEMLVYKRSLNFRVKSICHSDLEYKDLLYTSISLKWSLYFRSEW